MPSPSKHFTMGEVSSSRKRKVGDQRAGEKRSRGNSDSAGNGTGAKSRKGNAFQEKGKMGTLDSFDHVRKCPIHKRALE